MLEQQIPEAIAKIPTEALELVKWLGGVLLGLVIWNTKRTIRRVDNLEKDFIQHKIDDLEVHGKFEVDIAKNYVTKKDLEKHENNIIKAIKDLKK